MEFGGLTEARANECALECWEIACGENDGTSIPGNPEDAADAEIACREDGEQQQLMRFYGVDTLAALVKAQARHVEKLQAKLPPTPSLTPQQAREG